jgi:uncharacterized protein
VSLISVSGVFLNEISAAPFLLLRLDECFTIRDDSSPMLSSAIIRTVDFCARRKGTVIIMAFVLAALWGSYTISHFSLDTDVNNLISRDLPWRKRELAYQAGFPQTSQLILVVVDGPTAEQTGAAAHDLAQGLSHSPLFRSVDEMQGGTFFQQSRFLFLPAEEVAQQMTQLSNAEPVISILARDPSLRGLLRALSLSLQQFKYGTVSLDDAAQAFDRVALTLENVAKANPASFSWDALLAGQTEPGSLRRLVMVVPVLQTQDLEPGHKATEAIRKTATDLQLSSKFQAHIRVTGPVPIADEEFASVMEGVSLNGLITGLIVIAILWLALQSFRLVIAVTITLAVGLIVTASVGLFLVSALNPVSMAFAILFVGLGADFAVQFNLRYRAQRYASSELHQSLIEAGEHVGAPLTLAAVAAAIGFLSFTPTAYTGLAQLGIIAGCGMIVAFVASFTLLPALIAAVRPPPELKPLRQPALAPIDHFLKPHRIAVISLTAILVLAGSPFLTELKFDFNPLHLQSKHSQAVSTIGVAFKIYYIMAWRRGQTDILQSALTRAVFFSALLTGTAFGSLWFSSNPGMSSMGKLLALSLACTLASAVLFQPALMGDPRPKPKDPIV